MSRGIEARTLRRQWLSTVGRLLIVPVVLMAFAAPSPGNIGSCSDDNAGPDPVTHCVRKGEIQCQRMNFRFPGGPMAAGARESLAACVAALDMQCSGAVWAPGCQPTQSDVDRCYQALFTNPNDETGDNPPECQTLCGGV